MAYLNNGGNFVLTKQMWISAYVYEPNYGSCFIAGTKVTCIDNNGNYYRASIENVPNGTKVLGANGKVNTVLFTYKSYVGNKRNVLSLPINNTVLKFTDEHKLWVKSQNREYWAIYNKEQKDREDKIVDGSKSWIDVMYEKQCTENGLDISVLAPENVEQTAITKNIPCTILNPGDEVEYGTLHGWKPGIATIMHIEPEEPVYTLIVDGNRTFFADTVLVASRPYAADIDWTNYVKIEELSKQ